MYFTTLLQNQNTNRRDKNKNETNQKKKKNTEKPLKKGLTTATDEVHW